MEDEKKKEFEAIKESEEFKELGFTEEEILNSIDIAYSIIYFLGETTDIVSVTRYIEKLLNDKKPNYKVISNVIANLVNALDMNKNESIKSFIKIAESLREIFKRQFGEKAYAGVNIICELLRDYNSNKLTLDELLFIAEEVKDLSQTKGVYDFLKKIVEIREKDDKQFN